MIEIKYNNKTNKDIGLMVESINIQPPSKKKTKEDVPYMNGEYDFSTVGSSGEIVYTTRIIKIVFNTVCKSRADLYTKYSAAMSWLIDTGKNELRINEIPGYYFLGEVEVAPTFEEVARRGGKFEVDFICEPFKYRDFTENSQLWDDFNFLDDALQVLDFTISGTKAVTVINTGLARSPMLQCSAPLTLNYMGKSYTLKQGNNQFWGLKLKPGNNTLQFTGNGTVKVIFRKELI